MGTVCFACLYVVDLFPGCLFVWLLRVVVGSLLLHRWLICSLLWCFFVCIVVECWLATVVCFVLVCLIGF